MCEFFGVQAISLFLLSSYYALLKDLSLVAVVALLLYVSCYQVSSLFSSIFSGRLYSNANFCYQHLHPLKLKYMLDIKDCLTNISLSLHF